ncbi:MAG: amidase family protein [Mycoplasmoidaceae bacterium]
MKERIASFKEVIKTNRELNFYISEINEKQIQVNPKGKLAHLCYAIKDNFSVQGTITTGGSKFLEDYVAPYNATVIDLLNEAGAIPLIKTNLDEFGLGGTGTYSFNGLVLNPFDAKRISGGSSSGSAVAVAIDACDFALGTDTGDSIRRPASFLGVIGYKPTYGLISRYGVLPYAPSFDHVGLFAKDVAIIQNVLEVIAKKDHKDFSCQDIQLDFKKPQKFKKIKVAILEDLLSDLDQPYIKLFYDSLAKIKDLEITKTTYGKEILNLIPSIYKIISYSEAVSCYQNMTGITFGKNLGGKNFEEIATKNRTEFFGKELKRRFVIGAFCTSEENYEELFLKSKKGRTLIINKANEILKKQDFIISLGASHIAPLVEDIINKKQTDKNADYYLQVANFGGYPSITLPMGKINSLPIGINIMGKINSDVELLAFAKQICSDLKEKNNV